MNIFNERYWAHTKRNTVEFDIAGGKGGRIGNTSACECHNAVASKVIGENTTKVVQYAHDLLDGTAIFVLMPG